MSAATSVYSTAFSLVGLLLSYTPPPRDALCRVMFCYKDLSRLVVLLALVSEASFSVGSSYGRDS